MTEATRPRPLAVVVEDDPRIAQLLAAYLGDDGMAVEVFGDGDDAWRRLEHDVADLVVLDLMVAGWMGWSCVAGCGPSRMSRWSW